MKRAIGLLLIFALTLTAGCAEKQAEPVKRTYLDWFDTITTVTVYGAPAKDVDQIVADSYARLNDVFDAYAPHEGVNGLYQLNSAAGAWTDVDPALLDLLLLCNAWHAIAPQMDITRGALFEIWRAFRDGERELPTDGELAAAAAHGGWENVEIDEAAGRVRLLDPKMLIDVGSVAKGYAAGKLSGALTDAGYESHLVDAGGNVVAGARDNPFVIGVTNPRGDGIVVKLSLTNRAAVSSGDYQRYREYEGVRYHHLIDTQTFYPAASGIAQVTVLHEDSGFSDFLSTTLFIMDYETGRAFADANGYDAVWVMDNGTVYETDGAKEMVVK